MFCDLACDIVAAGLRAAAKGALPRSLCPCAHRRRPDRRPAADGDSL